MEETILQDNELIGKFIDVNISVTETYGRMYSLPYVHHSSSLRFHNSYDWLMPVVEKIEAMGV